jgi:short-subunit dehydrogenase involved in D-alanine esterification of teichoic acids
VVLMTTSHPIQPATVLITGGSEGIGRGLAARYLAAGNKVLITGRSAEKLEKVARELPVSSPSRMISADLRSARGSLVKKPGMMVNVTSGSAFVPQVFAPIYSASKAALLFRHPSSRPPGGSPSAQWNSCLLQSVQLWPVLGPHMAHHSTMPYSNACRTPIPT